MEVVYDFPEDSEYHELEGIPKKDDVMNFELTDGKSVTFGRNPICDVSIPIDDDLFDEEQFKI